MPIAADDPAVAEDEPAREERQPSFDDEGFAMPPQSPGGPGFDDTTMAPVAPAESGPVSLATKHAVHMLRERFGVSSGDEGTSGPASPATRQSLSVLFTDLCPERTSSRQDATKLFFETLVLATKDAVKVEQKADDGCGAPLRIRAKRGLWGQWAEMGVGQVEGGDAEQAQGEGEEEEGVAVDVV